MTYPQFDRLFGIYLNQDYAHWGDTLAEVVGAYRKDSTLDEIGALRTEIRAFRRAHVDDLDVAFEAAHGFDFGPELWGFNTDEFLAELTRMLS